MSAITLLATLFELWNWSVDTLGTTHASAALQALPFYNSYKVWLEGNGVAPEDWIDQIWEYTYNDSISWQENFKQMTELRPKIGTIEAAVATIPGDSLQIDDIELVVNENQLAIAAVKSDTEALATAITALLGSGGLDIQNQLGALQGELQTYSNGSDAAIEGYVEAARAAIINNAQSIATGDYNWETLRFAEVLAAIAALAFATPAQVVAARDSINGYTGDRADDVMGAVDTVGGEVLAEIALLPATIKTDADAQTAWVVDRVNERTDAQAQGIKDWDTGLSQWLDGEAVTRSTAATDLVVAQVLASEAVVGTKVDEARIVVNAIDARVVDLPATIKTDADAQTAWVLDNVADRIRPDGEAQRDYVVTQGEAQRDYVVAQVNQSVGVVETKVDEARIVINAMDERLLNVEARLYPTLAGTQTGEVGFDGITDWEQEADYYEVYIDAIPPGRPRIAIGDQEYLPHLAWCALKHGPSFERGPQLEFSHNTVLTGKLRASGLLVYCKPGTTGVIRAYTLS